MQPCPCGMSAMIVEMRTSPLDFGAVDHYFELFREFGQVVQWHLRSFRRISVIRNFHCLASGGGQHAAK